MGHTQSQKMKFVDKKQEKDMETNPAPKGMKTEDRDPANFNFLLLDNMTTTSFTDDEDLTQSEVYAIS